MPHFGENNATSADEKRIRAGSHFVFAAFFTVVLLLPYGDACVAAENRALIIGSATEILDAALAIEGVDDNLANKQLGKLTLRVGSPERCLQLLERPLLPGARFSLLADTLEAMAATGNKQQAESYLAQLKSESKPRLKGLGLTSPSAIQVNGQSSIRRGHARWLERQDQLTEAQQIKTNIRWRTLFVREGRICDAYRLVCEEAPDLVDVMIQETFEFNAYSDKEFSRWLHQLNLEHADELFTTIKSKRFNASILGPRPQVVTAIEAWASKLGRLDEVSLKLSQLYLDLGAIDSAERMLHAAVQQEGHTLADSMNLARIELGIDLIESAKKRLMESEPVLQAKLRLDKVDYEISSQVADYAELRLDAGIVKGTRFFVEELRESHPRKNSLRFQLLTNEADARRARKNYTDALQLTFPTAWGRNPSAKNPLLVAKLADHDPTLAAELIVGHNTNQSTRQIIVERVVLALLEAGKNEQALLLVSSLPEPIRNFHAKPSHFGSDQRLDLAALKQIAMLIPKSHLFSNQLALAFAQANDLVAAEKALAENSPNPHLQKFLLSNLPIDEAHEWIQPNYELASDLIVDDPTDVRKVIEFAKLIDNPNARCSFLVKAAANYLDKFE